ncbi:hypothetical protein VA7868_03271 [Vibrio aerogenes CECT 7868]|uniref:SH3 domain-containing protein n=1 Tax=Vibrio aerogenes CECT 7868 TaxID=1216006 RepID=A0A1M5ZUT2_9VIBR|nr:hypothetical protein [Vibrio aerogenes]SHI28000.1 hypothetical protein VA7868_03271 [Vibrio aerogenes CECT 7868]
MKKALMILILLLGIGGAAAGYYLFFMKTPEKPADAMSIEEPAPTEEMNAEPEPEKPVNTKFFVNEHKLPVRNERSESAYPVRYLYKGNQIIVLEQKDGWGRISRYFVYKEGGPEVAEWVSMQGLSETKPVITKEEKEEILTAYINKSDDLKLYKEKFLQVTGKLIDEKICSPEDFDELKGWVRSVKYKNRNVYFIYCGGLKVADKIYLDVNSGEIFYQ